MGDAGSVRDADAISVGIAALTATGLQSTSIEETVTALRAVVEHRDDLIRSRTQTVNRLHVLLTKLLPAGAPTSLSAEIAAALLHTGTTLTSLCTGLVGKILACR